MTFHRMRFTATSTALALLATTVGSGALLAQQPAQATPNAAAAEPAQKSQSEARAQPQDRDTQATSLPDADGKLMLAISDLDDTDVYNAAGNEIGEVRNVLIGPDNKVQLVLEYGGFLGVGERQVSLPLNHFQVRDDDLVITGPSDAELKALPAYTGPQAGYSDARDDQRVALVVFVAPASAVADLQKRTMPVSDLMDREIYNLAGQQIGDVERVLRGESDRLFVVVGHGGFLSVGEKQILLPIERLELRDDRLVISGLTDDEIKAMPEFKPSGRDFRELNGSDNAELTVYRG